MRIARFVAVTMIAVWTILAICVRRIDNNPTMTLILASLFVFGLLIPRHGPDERLRVAWVILGFVAATGFLVSTDQQELLSIQRCLIWLGMIVWMLWTLNDRTESDPRIADLLIRWFGVRWLSVLVAMIVVAIGIVTVNSPEYVHMGDLDSSFPPIVHSAKARKKSILVPFAVVGFGLLTSRQRSRPFLTLTAILFVLVGAGSLDLSANANVYHLLKIEMLEGLNFPSRSRLGRRDLAIEDMSTHFCRLAVLWTILPLWLMTWMIDWIEFFYHPFPLRNVGDQKAERH